MSPSDADDERSRDAGAHRDDEHAARDEATSTEEPVAPGSPGVAASPEDDAAREAAAWQAIIDNYGDRPTLDDGAATASPPDPPDPADHADHELEPPPQESVDVPEDHYVPPPPPPVPAATPPRLLAWVGLFGVPLLTLVALVTGIGLPQWLSVVLMGWFVGGFVFLVASMRPGPRDDHDDGAVV